MAVFLIDSIMFRHRFVCAAARDARRASRAHYARGVEPHDELVHACEAVTALAHCVPEAFTAKRENHPGRPNITACNNPHRERSFPFSSERYVSFQPYWSRN